MKKLKLGTHSFKLLSSDGDEDSLSSNHYLEDIEDSHFEDIEDCKEYLDNMSYIGLDMAAGILDNRVDDDDDIYVYTSCSLFQSRYLMKMMKSCHGVCNGTSLDS